MPDGWAAGKGFRAKDASASRPVPAVGTSKVSTMLLCVLGVTVCEGDNWEVVARRVIAACRGVDFGVRGWVVVWRMDELACVCVVWAARGAVVGRVYACSHTATLPRGLADEGKGV